MNPRIFSDNFISMALGYEIIISKDIWKYKSTDQASIDTVAEIIDTHQ